MTKPLAGVRIVSVEQFAAGPYGTMLLAGLGAEVIKIENPAIGGDPGRHSGPYRLGEADSQYFQTWNAGKKSVALDLKSPEGRRDFERLAATADAVVNNLRGDQPARLGLDYAALSRIKPAIVRAHISAYGRDNDRAARPGYDYLMQAETGLMSLTGEPGGPPSRFGAPATIDYSTGAMAMLGLLAALLGAQRTGKGCDVDVSLFDVALHQLGYAATWLLNGGEAVTRQPRSGHFASAPVQTFPTADGWIFVMCMTQGFWLALIGVLRRQDLGEDPRFIDIGARFANRDALTEILDAEFAKRGTDDWVQALSGVLPAAPVRELAQALDNPFVRETGMIRASPHPADPEFRLMSSPIRIDGERADAGVCSPLGADNAVLRK